MYIFIYLVYVYSVINLILEQEQCVLIAVKNIRLLNYDFNCVFLTYIPKTFLLNIK